MLRISDFSGGLNLRSNPSAMPPNQSPDCLNFMINTDGSLTKRKGYTLAYTGPAGGALNGVYLFDKAGTIFPMMSTATRISDGTSAVSTVASATRRFFNEFNDYCIITSASHDPLLYTGSGTANPIQFSDENGTNKAAIRMVETKTHLQRVWGYGPNSSNLYYSEIGYYNRWNGNNLISIEPFDGGTITHIEEIFDSLAIYKTTGIWILRGVSNSDFTVSKVVDSKCLAGPLAIACVDNVHFFLDKNDGVFAFDGVNFKSMSDAINPELKTVTNANSTMAFQDGYIWLTSGGKTYCMDVRTGAWTRHSIPANQWIKTGTNLLFASDDGKVYQMGGYNDNNAPISAYYYTPYIDMGAPDIIKQFVRIKPDITAGGNNIQVEYNFDEGKGSGAMTFSGANTSDRWGVMKWGVGEWYTPPDTTQYSDAVSLPNRAYGISVQVCFKESGDLPGGTISGTLFEERPKRRVW